MRVYLLVCCIALMSACKKAPVDTPLADTPTTQTAPPRHVESPVGEEVAESTDDEPKSIVDSLCTLFPLRTVDYSPKNFSVGEEAGEMQIYLYNLMMQYATQEEVNICHDLPHGNRLDYSDASFLSLILGVASANQLLIEQLTGENPLYATPNSTELIDYYGNDDASVRFLRVIDNQFTLEEKVWLRKIGGQVALANTEDQYFVSQMTTKILVKLLYQQKQLNELIRSLKKQVKKK